MELRVLGPLHVLDDGRAITVGGGRERALLAALGMARGDALSSDTLVDALWGEHPPRSAAKQLQNHVLRLRKVLGSEAICTTPFGYALGEGLTVDAARFESELRDARAAVARGVPGDSLPFYSAALAEWRGRPFAELSGWQPAEAETARLDELRRLSEEEEIDARLACGAHGECVADLEVLVSDEPLREHRWAQLMLALYRSGRQGDALRAYQRARETLARELGIEPSKELGRLEEAILSQRPDVDWQPSEGAEHPAPKLLPTGVVTFLLSDIVGSTSLWERDAKTMATAVARHDALMHGAVDAHGGIVLKARGEGDSTFSVFARATDALAAALAAQRALVSEAWPESTQLSVRMALHTGEAFERGGDYYGPTVNWAARIRSLATGGQVLVSQSTGELVRDHLPEQASLVELGSHVLSDLVRAERIAGLAAPGLPEPATLAADTLETADRISLPVPGVLRDGAGELFVGRGPELDALIRAWKDASEGERRAVLIGGEPGVGKTRLAAELARTVAAEGAAVLYGRCDEDLGIPYQPWVEALRHVITHEPRDLLVDHLGAHSAALTRLLPELAQRVGEQPGAQPVDPDAERSVLFGAIVELLARLGRDTPVLLVLEDLHWADKPSLLLLRHVIASTDSHRLLVVGTYRSSDLGAEHPLTDVLAALHRDQHAKRVSLRGLSDADVVALLEAAAGHTLEEAGVALAHALHRETDGNPFFTGEILRHLTETGAISLRDDGRWTADVDFRDHDALPTSVREVIGRRVARLGEETEQALRAAAAIGRDFELNLLAEVTDESEEHLLDLLDAAIDAVLVREVPQRPGRLSFTHALVEHTLYDDLGPTRRQRLHRRVAVALEELCADDPGDRLGELAYHWAQGSQPADVHKAVDYARRAGDHALAKLAPDDAVIWYSQALELIDGQLPPDEMARAETLVDLGTGQRQAGDARSRETLLGAADLAQRLDHAALLVRAALANNRGRPSNAGAVDQQRIDTLGAALAATAGSETPERAMLLATLAVELTWGDRDRARSLSDEALAMARRVGDDRTLWEVLAKRHGTIWSPATLNELTTNAYEQREVAERLGDRHFRANAALSLCDAAIMRGDIIEADENLELMIRDAAETGLAPARSSAARYSAWRRLLAGHIDAAEQAAGEALQIASQSGELDAFVYYAAQIYGVRRAQGRLGEIIELIERAVEENPGLPAFRAVLAVALCELDRVDDARVVFAPLVASGFTEFPFDPPWLTAMSLCADAAAYLEHRTAAQTLAELLAPWRDQLAFTGPTCNGSIARPLGLALATAGRLDEANEAFAHAAAVHETIEAPIELARTQLNWARMLASRGRPGDPDRARALLDDALRTAIRLGLATIQTQAQALRADLAAK